MNTTLLRANIVGKAIQEVKTMNIDFGTSYPVVKNGIVVSTVDAAYPLDYNGGDWDIVDDFYAEACSPAEGDQ